MSYNFEDLQSHNDEFVRGTVQQVEKATYRDEDFKPEDYSQVTVNDKMYSFCDIDIDIRPGMEIEFVEANGVTGTRFIRMETMRINGKSILAGLSPK